MSILQYCTNKKLQFLDQCICCGICADKCPIVPFTSIKETSSRAIQEAVYDSVENDAFNPLACTKAFACMGCFKCIADICPQGLNPMFINEIIKGTYISQGKADAAFIDTRGPESPQRIIARVQLTENEYKRITTPSPRQDVKYVFFPGCNVYFQPEKLLNALDIMDAAGDSYAFVPGLDDCCGAAHFFSGLQKEGSLRAEELMARLAGYHPETVILWCPTCHCQFNEYISPSMDLPFSVVSFPQYLAERMSRLPLDHPETDTIVTLHEPCKSAYTGVDLTGPRQVLSQLPGIRLTEMEHHGRNTMCCGSGAASWFPDSCSRIQDFRLKEAEQTGADQMVTICHYCGQVFQSRCNEFDFKVVNYVNLVAESMGINRPDKFKQYSQWNDLEFILKDIGSKIEKLPFNHEIIIETLRSVFIRKAVS